MRDTLGNHRHGRSSPRAPLNELANEKDRLALELDKYNSACSVQNTRNCACNGIACYTRELGTVVIVKAGFEGFASFAMISPDKAYIVYILD